MAHMPEINVILFQEPVQEKLSIPPIKVEVLPDILLSAPTIYWKNEEGVPVADTSMDAEESVATTFEMGTVINNPEPEQSTPQLNAMPSLTIRKLIAKLNDTLRISRERKRQLALLRRQLHRREKRITSMKHIIAELRKKNFIQEKSLDVIAKLGEPEKLFLEQYSKAESNLYQDSIQRD